MSTPSNKIVQFRDRVTDASIYPVGRMDITFDSSGYSLNSYVTEYYVNAHDPSANSENKYDSSKLYSLEQAIAATPKEYQRKGSKILFRDSANDGNISIYRNAGDSSDPSFVKIEEYNVDAFIYDNGYKNSVIAKDSCSGADGSFAFASGYKVFAHGDYSHAEGLGDVVKVGNNNILSSFDDYNGECICSPGMDDYNYVEKGDVLLLGNAFAVVTNVNITEDPSVFYVETDASGSIGIGSAIKRVRGVSLGKRSHSEGLYSRSIGDDSHSEGTGTTAYGVSSHAEGYGTKAYGVYSHAEGTGTTAYGVSSHAEGYSTETYGFGEHSCGEYNYSSSDGSTRFSVGVGNYSSRKNAIEVRTDGSIYIKGVGNYDGSIKTDVSTYSLQDSLYGRNCFTYNYNNNIIRFYGNKIDIFYNTITFNTSYSNVLYIGDSNTLQELQTYIERFVCCDDLISRRYQSYAEYFINCSLSFYPKNTTSGNFYFYHGVFLYTYNAWSESSPQWPRLFSLCYQLPYHTYDSPEDRRAVVGFQVNDSNATKISQIAISTYKE